MIYVDKASVCPQNVNLYSWWHKQKPDSIIRPSTRINMIAAMILPHKYAFMLKTGATISDYMVSFFELLHDKLCDWFGEEYLKSTVIVLDNASLHVSDRCKAYFKWKMLSYLHCQLTLQSKITLNRSSSDLKQTFRSATLARGG